MVGAMSSWMVVGFFAVVSVVLGVLLGILVSKVLLRSPFPAGVSIAEFCRRIVAMAQPAEPSPVLQLLASQQCAERLFTDEQYLLLKAYESYLLAAAQRGGYSLDSTADGLGAKNIKTAG